MERASNPFYNAGETIVAYLPNLFAGLILLAIGWVLGWLAKRVVVQVCVVLRLDRLLRTFRWGAIFSKADVRYALYDAIGNTSFFIVFLVFLNAAMASLQLTVLSELIQQGVLFIPRLITSLLILGLGWMVGGWVAATVQKALIKEEIPRATLVARFTKSIVLLFFSAMALTELGIANEIVVIGYSVIMATLGILAIVFASFGGKSFMTRVMGSLQ